MNDARRSPIPIVFVSSTVEDLTRYRAAVSNAANTAGCLPRMMEYFAAAGDKPPLDACLARVSEADVLVVVVAHRFGWVPPDQQAGEHKSITWLECERAVADGTEVLAFLLDETYAWPEDDREEYALTQAVREGKATPELLQSVQRNVTSLRQFKAWLSARAIRATFTTPEDLQGKVLHALHEWTQRHPDLATPPTTKTRPPADPTTYLRTLLERNRYIDIRGLQVGAGKAYRFPIEELFISLTSTGRPHAPDAADADKAKRGSPSQSEDRGMAAPAVLPLHAALAHRRLVVVGDPGSGKTTFLRRVVCALAESLLGDVPNAAEARLGMKETPLPLLVPVADLVEHVAQVRRAPSEHPASVESPAWLPHFLGAVSREAKWGLDREFFEQRLEDGSALVLLDGLDEAPDRLARGSVARLIRNAATAYPRSQFVVTSRPAAYTDEAVLAGFEHAWIDPLADEAIHTFLTRWSEALHPGSPREAASHRDELQAALANRPDMRRLVRNPVMLTALAVVHWNERRLPEQRADLYDSIVKWLARSRQQRPGRSTAEQCITVLQELALAMQSHPEGRQVQVSKRWAAEALAQELDAGAHSRHGIERAARFLEEEELDSGLVIARGHELRFWHLTFQEFLAARAIAARTELAQRKVLFGKPRTLYLPEWREVVLLLAGVLHQQGSKKVDGLVSAVLENLGRNPSLAAKARCAGLLGALFRDLKPLGYEPADVRYPRLIDEVYAIFDAGRSESLAIQDRIEAAEALGQAGDPRIDSKHPKYWVRIPAREFLMGSQKTDRSQPNYDDEAFDDELPPHMVSLNEYRIAAYPTTVGEYERFVADGGYEERRWWAAGGFGKFNEPDEWADQTAFPNHPVVGVSWFEATAYAAWSGCRLPTEAEWEHAARGTGGRKFPWGNEPADPSRLNYLESWIGRPTPVGIYPLGATPDGIYDMAGNVWEWCQDAYAPYGATPQTVPDPLKEGDVVRVVRGGSWFFDSRLARAAFLFDVRPEIRFVYLGFRVVGAA